MNVNVNHVRGKQMKSVLYLEAGRVDHGDVGAELVAEEVPGAEGGHPGLGLEPVAHREGELRPVLLPLAHLARHHVQCYDNTTSRASNEGYPRVPEDFIITEKAPTRLKVSTSAFSFKTLLRHYVLKRH